MHIRRQFWLRNEKKQATNFEAYVTCRAQDWRNLSLGRNIGMIGVTSHSAAVTPPHLCENEDQRSQLVKGRQLARAGFRGCS